jgi:hypothetical protein
LRSKEEGQEVEKRGGKPAGGEERGRARRLRSKEEG